MGRNLVVKLLKTNKEVIEQRLFESKGHSQLTMSASEVGHLNYITHLIARAEGLGLSGNYNIIMEVRNS